MQKFESPEISFYYPENWNLFVNDGDEHSGEEETNEVTLQSPGSSQLTIAIYESFEDSQDLVDRTLNALKDVYEDVEVDEASDMVAEHQLNGLDATFFYLDLLVVAEIRIVDRENDKILFLLQSESRELENNRDVFTAIITSMLKPEIMDEH